MESNIKEETEFLCSTCSKEPSGHINVERFITSLDKCFLTNDLKKAQEIIDFWKAEAFALNDERGRLSIVNEELGFTAAPPMQKKVLKQ